MPTLRRILKYTPAYSIMKIKPTPETLWKRPAYLPYVHLPLADEVITHAEKHLGCTLPDDFLNVLRVQNGGAIRFRTPNSSSELIAGIGPTFPSITTFYLKDSEEYVDFSLDGLVAFDGDGHWYHCLDFRSDAKNPSVSYVDLECNSEHQIADTFSSFLELLELDIKNELVITNVSNLDDARSRLQELFGSQLQQGVPYWMCHAGKNRNDCFWITGNKVARGYSGEPDSFRFEGNALLFPELSPDAVFFESSVGHLDSYRAILRDAGLELVDIESAWHAPKKSQSRWR